MRYYSTRGKADYATAAEAIIKGLAPDGGLYVPADKLSLLDIPALRGKSYKELAGLVFEPFLSGYDNSEIESYLEAAYSSINFEHPDITPLKKLSSDLWVLELFHGPTYAFKDIALQILPHLLSAAIKKTGEEAEIVILTATSGDTGKSALEGFRDVKGTKIIVYYPDKGISAIQERQMTTQEGGNVAVAAVTGNFDSAQSGVKSIFSDKNLADKLAGAGYKLSSANSINWGRLLPQINYYFFAYLNLLDRGAVEPGSKINFVVPTGNFGNILAGYYAKQLGLPVNRLICAANSNNVLAEFINSGVYDSKRGLHQTTSPSMDILVSSNLERLLFELTGHDCERITGWMEQLKETGKYQIDSKALALLQELFWSDFADDKETAATIAAVYKESGYLMDTHTAVGKKVSDSYRTRVQDKTINILLSTASPYKFSSSVIEALFGKNSYEGYSEFSLLKILSEESGTAVPANLAGLEGKKVKHKQVIEPSEMRDHLLTVLNL